MMRDRWFKWSLLLHMVTILQHTSSRLSLCLLCNYTYISNLIRELDWIWGMSKNGTKAQYCNLELGCILQMMIPQAMSPCDLGANPGRSGLKLVAVDSWGASPLKPLQKLPVRCLSSYWSTMIWGWHLSRNSGNTWPLPLLQWLERPRRLHTGYNVAAELNIPLYVSVDFSKSRIAELPLVQSV